MPLSLDDLSVSCLDVSASADFCRVVFSAPVFVDGRKATIDLHGTGRLVLVTAGPAGSDPAPGISGARSVLTCLLPGPDDVSAVMAGAAAHGADIFKPARGPLFGSFSGSFMAPEGTVWKLVATGWARPSAEGPVRPIETTLILGVREPGAAKAFYTALGMRVDRDHGNQYVDFLPRSGAFRLCLMHEPALSMDVGAGDPHVGNPSVTPIHRAASLEEADRIVSAAVAGGGTQAGHQVQGSATITDPDGHRWLISSPHS